MIKVFVFILMVGFISCKTTIDPPEIEKIQEVIKVEDDYKPLGNDFISGKVIHNDTLTTDLVAIKLIVNDSVCINSYGNFEGAFSFNYDRSMINSNSLLEFVFRDYVIEKIPFMDLLKNKTVQLNKNGKLVTYEEYRTFYEAIRACTR